MNDLETFSFWISAFTALASALGVVLSKRIVYGVLLLTVTMVSLSVMFLALEAPFVAVIQVLIYAGAILVLFLLVMMLLGMEGAALETQNISFKDRAASLILIAALLIELFVIVLKQDVAPIAKGVVVGTVEAIGNSLFTQYLLPFELVSIILLVGIFGVVGLGQKETPNARDAG